MTQAATKAQRRPNGAWIREIMEREGLTIGQLGRIIRRYGEKQKPGWPMRCSDLLLENLMTVPGYITHPDIANLISDVLGATARQRDSLVALHRRGGYRQKNHPGLAETRLALSAYRLTPLASAQSRPAYRYTAVVAVDMEGRERARYASIIEASADLGLSESVITARINREVVNEFRFETKLTFRRTSDWDKMTVDQQREDILSRIRMAAKPAPPNSRPVYEVTRAGEVVAEYVNIGDAAAKRHLAESTVRMRLTRKMKENEFMNLRGETFRYKDEWDAMSEEEREKDLAYSIKFIGRRGRRVKNFEYDD